MRKSFNFTGRPQSSFQGDNCRESREGLHLNSGRNYLSNSQSEIVAKFKKDLKIELKDVQNEIKTIKAIFPQIKKSVYNILTYYK